MTPAWLTGTAYAHRGLFDPARGLPENSPSAFQAAIAGGYGIELDVQESGDGEAMVFHDYALSRLTGESGKVAALSADALRRIPLKGSDDRIPTLADVLDLVAGRAPILIEVKTHRWTPGRLETAVVRALEGYRGPAAVMSFNIRSVSWFARHAPALSRGLVATDMRHGGGDLPLSVGLTPLRFSIARCRAAFLAYDFRLIPSEATERLRARGVPVLTWTVKRAEDRARAEQAADAMIFEGWKP